MPNREGSENRKNYLYENEVKSPVLFLMDNQQRSPEQGNAQRLFQMEVDTSVSKQLAPIIYF